MAALVVTVLISFAMGVAVTFPVAYCLGKDSNKETP